MTLDGECGVCGTKLELETMTGEGGTWSCSCGNTRLTSLNHGKLPVILDSITPYHPDHPDYVTPEEHP